MSSRKASTQRLLAQALNWFRGQPRSAIETSATESLLTHVVVGRGTLGSITEALLAILWLEEGWRQQLNVDILEDGLNDFRVLAHSDVVVAILDSTHHRGEAEEETRRSEGSSHFEVLTVCRPSKREQEGQANTGTGRLLYLAEVNLLQQLPAADSTAGPLGKH